MMLLGVPLPYPDYAKDDADLLPFWLCGSSMSKVLTALAKSSPQLGFTGSKECMSAALLLQCMRNLPIAFPEEKKLQAAVTKAGVTVISHYTEQCKGAKPSRLNDLFIETVSKAWWAGVKSMRVRPQ